MTTPAPPLTAAQRDLVAANLGLAYGEARRPGRRRSGDLQAVDDAAVDGLIRAARAFDPGLGYRFSTLATICARNAIRGVAIHANRARRRAPAPLVSLEASGIEPAARAASPDHDAGRFEALLGPLRARDREVLRIRFAEGLTLRAAGDRLGCTREWVRKIEVGALARLRDREVS
jgi:RNA polymerase sigma factor (sigma-70 family)